MRTLVLTPEDESGPLLAGLRGRALYFSVLQQCIIWSFQDPRRAVALHVQSWLYEHPA
jgi:hypothetical protein